jgi:hypothetical protein
MASVIGLSGSPSVSPKPRAPSRMSSTGAGWVGVGAAGGGAVCFGASVPPVVGGPFSRKGRTEGLCAGACGAVTGLPLDGGAPAGGAAEASSVRADAGGRDTSAGGATSVPTISAFSSAEPGVPASPMFGNDGPEAISRSDPTLPSPPPEATAPEATSKTTDAMKVAPAAPASWPVHVRTSPTRQW